MLSTFLIGSFLLFKKVLSIQLRNSITTVLLSIYLIIHSQNNVCSIESHIFTEIPIESICGL